MLLCSLRLLELVTWASLPHPRALVQKQLIKSKWLYLDGPSSHSCFRVAMCSPLFYFIVCLLCKCLDTLDNIILKFVVVCLFPVLQLETCNS